MENENILLKKIQDAKIKYTEGTSQEEIIGWEKQCKKFLQVLSVKDNKGIQMVLEKFTIELKEIDELLLNADSKLLSTEERDRVLDRKVMYSRFLDMFADAETGLVALEKKVDEDIAE